MKVRSCYEIFHFCVVTFEHDKGIPLSKHKAFCNIPSFELSQLTQRAVIFQFNVGQIKVAYPKAKLTLLSLI